MLKFLLTLTLLFLSSCTADSKQTPIIPKEVLFGDPAKTSPRLSPDGKQIAYLAPDKNNVMNVWIEPLDKSRKARLVTLEKKRGIPDFFWQYDNQHILYTQDQGGNENFHLYQTDIHSLETRDLTPFLNVRAQPLAYEPEFPNDLLVMLNARNPALHDVYRVNLKDGTASLEVDNDFGAFTFSADHNLKVRIAAKYDEEGNTVIFTRDAKEFPWREIAKWSPLDTGFAYDFSPDNESLYVSSNEETNTLQLYKINLKTGSKEFVVGDMDYDISGPLVNPISNKIEAIKIYRERPEWIVLDPKMGVDLNVLNKKNEEIQITSRDRRDRKWIVAYLSDRHSPHYYLYDRVSKLSQFLFAGKPELDKYPLSKMRPVKFTARDGLPLEGYLTLPVGKKHKNLPTLLLVHGGPWARDTWGYKSSVQWLANRGYAVFQINYRGSTGYGKEHLNAGNREWAGKMHDDLLDGKQWLIDQGYSDPDKVAIFGGSYGGYATLVALTFTPKEFCCGVDIVGPSNLVTLLKTVPPYWKPMRAKFDVHVGNVDTEEDFLVSRSPLFKAEQIVRPLLIGQGANDPRVKQAESDQIVEAMQKNGQEVEYVLFSDEGHGFRRPENRMKFFTIAENFLGKHLGGKVEN